MPVAQVVDLARMELEAQVPVSEIPFVKVGQEMLFRSTASPGRRFAGKVERVNPSADAGSRSIAVFVDTPQRRRDRSRAACSPTARSPPPPAPRST